MKKQVGTVIHEPEMFDHMIQYEVSIDGEEFTAESDGKQAIKDYLFVRKGQSIEIEGEAINRHIEVQNAKIDIFHIVNTQ